MFPGISGGLSLTLDVEQYNYMRSLSDSAGVFLLIQHQDEANQFVQDLAYSISSGYHTNVALKRETVNTVNLMYIFI